MNALKKLLLVSETKACGPIDGSDSKDTFIPNDYESQIKITWKVLLFVFVIVGLIACAIVPWLVGIIQILKFVF